MEWYFWFTLLFLLIQFLTFKITLSYHQKTQNFNWKFTFSNLCEQNWNWNCFQNKNGSQIGIAKSRNNETVWKHKKDVDNNKNGDNAPNLESVEFVLVQCNLVKNNYQHTSKVLFTFFSNKQFGQLINISPHPLTMMNTINTDFSYVEIGSQTKPVKHLKLKIMLIWH